MTGETNRELAVGARRASIAMALVGLAALMRATDLGMVALLELTSLRESETFVEIFNAFVDHENWLLMSTSIAGLIAFLAWVHRAVRNVSHLESEVVLPASPGQAVAYFFIPIANFYLPYRVV